jgi:citronellyl-CoA dehydrogenase
MLGLSEEHKIFKKTVKDFVEKEIRPYVLEWEEAGRTPREIWKRCGELGFLGIRYPEEYGGMNVDFTYTSIFFQELAKCGSSGVALGISAQAEMATPAIGSFGSEFLKKTYLAPAIAGDMICSIAVTEPDHGSDVAAIETRAVKKGNSWVINGKKTYITNGTQADFVTLLARTNDEPGYRGLSLFVVPTNLPGFSKGKPLKKTCYPSSDTAELTFENVEVSNEHIIGQEGQGFTYQMKQFQYERLVGCMLGMGGIKRSYELTKQFIRERHAFGKPLANMQTIRHKMAQMAAEMNLVDNSLRAIVILADMGIDFTKQVTMLKLTQAQIQQRVLEECVQIHGGAGLMTEYEVARYFRDAKLMSIGGGTNEIMKEIISKMEGLE